ncbi:MAG: Rrf2 family transcriptional regulator [bacterium]
MNVTTRARYALRAVLDIATNGREKPVRAADVALRQGISAGYLERLLVALGEAGVVESRRGPGGGYLLARSADELTVRDVFLASGEPVELAPCLGEDCTACGRATACPVRDVWGGLARATESYLAALSISDLVDSGSRVANDKKNGLRPLRAPAGE